VDVHFILILALYDTPSTDHSQTLDRPTHAFDIRGGFLGLFTIGMLGSSLQLAWLNLSTIENLNHRTKVWTLAILIPRPDEFDRVQQGMPLRFPRVSYPDIYSRSGSDTSGNAAVIPRREFAILHTKPGENPFDIGSGLANLREVMGYSVLDWLLPIKHSPCADHSGRECAFALGPVVQRLREEAGIGQPRKRPGDAPSRGQARQTERNGEPSSRSRKPSTNEGDASRTKKHRRHHRKRKDGEPSSTRT
jgi:palmitoyltransferase